MSEERSNPMHVLLVQDTEDVEVSDPPQYLRDSEQIQGEMLAELVQSTVSDTASVIDYSDCEMYTTAIPAEFTGSLPEGTVLQMGSDNGILTVACMPNLSCVNMDGFPVIIGHNDISETTDSTIMEVDRAIEDHCNAIINSKSTSPIFESGTISEIVGPVSNENDQQVLNFDEILGETTERQSEAEAHKFDMPNPVSHINADCARNIEVDMSESCFENSENLLNNTTEKDGENVVVIDVSQPIQLSHNSLIVINGQRCLLQHGSDTGQIIAYPVKEPEIPKKKRGRPRKSELQVSKTKDLPPPSPEQEFDEISDADDENNTESGVEAGRIEIPTEDGGLVRRSSRRRKKTRFLQDYATGSLQTVLGSEEEFSDSELVETVESPHRKKGRGKKKTKILESEATPLLGQTPNNLFPFLQPSKRGRGRPRRYGTPPTMQGFLIQTADGQSFMMQIPSNSLPNQMSLQEVAENIASSLNSHMAQLAGTILPNIKDALSTSDPQLECSQPDIQSESNGSVPVPVPDISKFLENAINPASINPPEVMPPTAPLPRKRGRPRKYPMRPKDATIIPSSTLPVLPSSSLAASSEPALNTSLPSQSDPESSHLEPDMENIDVCMVLENNISNANDKNLSELCLTEDTGNHPVPENATEKLSQNLHNDQLTVSSDQEIVHSLLVTESYLFRNKEDSSVTMSAVESVSESENFPESSLVSNHHLISEVPEVPKESDTCKPTQTVDESVASVVSATTVIPVPENILPLLSIKGETPIKIGLRDKEGMMDKIRCSECQFQAYHLLQYRKHILTHENAHKCKFCDFVCLGEEDLMKHHQEKHPRNICTVGSRTTEHTYIMKRPYQKLVGGSCKCRLCGKTYKDQYILKMHVKLVHLPASVLFQCSECGKKFNRKAHLTRHLRIHDPVKPYQCNYCQYKGCEKSDISKHIVIHEDPKHICEICGKPFRHMKNKEIHLKRHKGQRDFKCGVCDFYGYTFTDIRKHIERRHSDPQTIICNKCGQAFKTESLLQEHQDNNQCEVFVIEQSMCETEIIQTTEESEILEEEAQFIVPESIQSDGCTENTEPEPEKMSHSEEFLDLENRKIILPEGSHLFSSKGQLAIFTSEEEGTTQLALLSENGELSALNGSFKQEFLNSKSHLPVDSNQQIKCTLVD